jgi:hypothetical protein
MEAGFEAIAIPLEAWLLYYLSKDHTSSSRLCIQVMVGQCP